jgi:metal-responsive CopG/Arc/MetJ family transcriptional regulator
MTVNLPASLLDALDDVMLERGGTRSGFIRMAVTEWLARQAQSDPL